MPYKDPAKQKEYLKKYEERPERIKWKQDYEKTPKRIKSNRINSWKLLGIRCDGGWEEVYDWYSETTNCDICSKLFTESMDKCLDHDHHIDGYNIRGILCQKCNNIRNEI